MITPENVIFGQKYMYDFLEVGPGLRFVGRGVFLSSFSPPSGPHLALKYVQKGLFTPFTYPQT